MDIIKQLNNAIAYIENNLCGEIDTNKIAEIALCPYDKFKRFFSYMTNMSVSEYIRKRRLTLAAYELVNEQQSSIEHLTKSRDKWSKSAKLHSEYFDCLEKAIEIAYEEKPYPKIEDIMNIYSKLEKEINDE